MYKSVNALLNVMNKIVRLHYTGMNEIYTEGTVAFSNGNIIIYYDL